MSNLEKISQAWHSLVEAALGEGYVHDRAWFLSQETVKVTPMEGGMVELSVSYSYSDLGGDPMAANVPRIMAGALKKEGVKADRISLSAGSYKDYGIDCYSGQLKTIMPVSEETFMLLGRAVDGAKLINPFLVEQGHKIAALIAEAKKIASKAGDYRGVTSEQLKYWQDSLPKEIKELLASSLQINR